MDPFQLLDRIAFFGPWIISGITVYELSNQAPYLISFAFFYFVNNQINEYLKLWIREERPIGSRSIVGEKMEGAHLYGMPSGHAQLSFYALTFYYQATEKPKTTLGMLFLTALTLYQRWKYKNHSLEQLAAGSVMGFLVGIIGYQVSKKAIEKKDKMFF